MQHLLVINTGGTIGMKPSESGLVPDPDFLEQHCHHAYFKNRPTLQVTWHEWTPLIDSSQIHPDQWNQIAQLIADNAASHDGVLIIHGTDTLAYTSSALSFMLRGLSLPIVITGAMRSIQEPDSDGPDNLNLAIHTCLKSGTTGVWVCFHHKIMPGSHISKMHASAADAFVSPLPDKRTHYEPNVPHRIAWILPEQCGIDVFTYYPGCPLDALATMVTNDNRALVLRSFGSGNLPETGEFTHYLRTAMAANKTVVNISQCFVSQVDMARYQVGGHLVELGVISAFTMTFEAVITKLMIILSHSQNHEEIAAQFSEEWTLEMPLYEG